MDFRTALDLLPLVAILRGVEPEQSLEIAQAVVEEGFRIVEVPLNSPHPFESIRRIAKEQPGVLVGAGTVMSESDVESVANAGGRLIVMPHSDPAVIQAAKSRNLVCLPGVATPSEAFAAVAGGADALKLFPAETLPPAVVKAWRAVVPKSVSLLPVGGISPDSMAAYLKAGANGFGLGSALYRAGMTSTEVAANARTFVGAWNAAKC